jgi:predicted AAA+ superfamily ATPase
MYLARHLEPKLALTRQHAKVILITGARQVGKSTLLRHCLPDLPHITFDPIQDFYNVREDPGLFLSQFQGPLILDEIQFYPELLSALKRRVDQSSAPGQYFLTGSQNLSVLKNVSETMAGRVAILNLLPMTLHEKRAVPEQHWLPVLLEDPSRLPERFKGCIPDIALWDVLWRGGMPGFMEIPTAGYSTMFESYVQTYVERDVRLVENIQDLRAFDRFVRIMAALSSQEINTSTLGQEIGVSHKTITRWINVLTYTYQCHLLDPYHGNTLKRITKKPKEIFSDTGLACHLIRLTTPQSLGSYPQLGALFESFVTNQIKAVLNSLPQSVNLYHWRTHSGAEIDALIEKDGFFYPIEIKMKTVLTKRDTKGIKAFVETYPESKVKKGIIIYPGDRCFHLDDFVIAVPYHGLFG